MVQNNTIELFLNSRVVKDFKNMERRKQKRYSWPSDIHLELAQAEPIEDLTPESFTVFGTDISSSGIGIHSRHPLNVSQVVRISVPSAITEVPIPSLAQVRWVESIPEGGQRAGLYFLS